MPSGDSRRLGAAHAPREPADTPPARGRARRSVLRFASSYVNCHVRRGIRYASGLYKWWYVDGTVPVDLRMLISPLRYDILVRADFFQLLDQFRPLYDADPPAFVALASDSAYYRWYLNVEMATYRPYFLHDEPAFRRHFARRVRRNVELLDRFRAMGFDTTQTVTLFAGQQTSSTRTGKWVPRPFYAGDGCHRLALLWYSGAQELQPEQYRIRFEQRLRPLDMTSRVLSQGIGREQYWKFLSYYYSDALFESSAPLLRWVNEHRPNVYRELQDIITVDSACFGEQAANVLPIQLLTGGISSPT